MSPGRVEDLTVITKHRDSALYGLNATNAGI